jgi:hypothetical protein
MSKTNLLPIVLLLCLLAGPLPVYAQNSIYPGEYEETHPYLMYNGSWQPVTGSLYTENHALCTTDEFAYVRFTFSGWGILLTRDTGPSYGMMQVQLDNDGTWRNWLNNEAAVVEHGVRVHLADTSPQPNSWQHHEMIIRNTAGSTLCIDQIQVMSNPAWPIPTPWPTPDATPFINTWDQGMELAQHMINGWDWANNQTIIGKQEGAEAHAMGALDLLMVGMMLGAIFSVLAGIIQRITSRIHIRI